MDRIRDNNGIIPDNVGPTGKVGEQRNGQWWGGFYGWNSRNSARNAFLAATIAAECALLLTGDFGYLELIKSSQWRPHSFRVGRKLRLLFYCKILEKMV